MSLVVDTGKYLHDSQTSFVSVATCYALHNAYISLMDYMVSTTGWQKSKTVVSCYTYRCWQIAWFLPISSKVWGEEEEMSCCDVQTLEIHQDCHFHCIYVQCTSSLLYQLHWCSISCSKSNHRQQACTYSYQLLPTKLHVRHVYTIVSHVASS